MFRAAMFAVLAVALSSSSALAQQAAMVPVAAEPSVYFALNTEGRPAMLLSMYAAQGVLQGLDAYTTLKSLSAGNREMNPLLKSGNPALIIGAKVAVSSLNIYLAEKMWKRNRKAAIATMIVTNLMTSAVVIHNTRVINSR